MFDRLLRKKPNAHAITLVSIFMNRINRTSSWRDLLPDKKRAKYMKEARLSCEKQYKEFTMRMAKVRKVQEEKRLNKIQLKQGCQ